MNYFVRSTVLLYLCSASGIAAASGESLGDTSQRAEAGFAPGVVTVIPPAPQADETFSGPHVLQSLLDAHPEIAIDEKTHPNGTAHTQPTSRMLIDMAQDVILRHEVYCLEFAFKPLRHIHVDIPRPDGRLQRKLIWYMVYRVRYRGGDLRPTVDRVGDSKLHRRIEAIHYDTRRFFPTFKLLDYANGRTYVDQILPTAAKRIQLREKISGPLYNSVDIARVQIPYESDAESHGVWGVATWEDIDPNLDFLSIDVSGLTNAYQQNGDGIKAKYGRKVLRLNFYRPGDTMNQTADQIRFGMPAFKDAKEQQYILKQYGVDDRTDYEWRFVP